MRAIFLILSLLVIVGFAHAAVPDQLSCDAEPAIIHATTDVNNPSSTEITVQVLAEYPDGSLEPVRMCGIEVTCESQNTDILNDGLGGGSITESLDEFGKAAFVFKSTGANVANIGQVEIVCRSLQQQRCNSFVDVVSRLPETLELSACPWTSGPTDTIPDILADGVSKIKIAAQLKEDDTGNLIPVKREGISITFTSDDTSILKACDDGSSQDVQPTDIEGVAFAEFCSSGSGSENVGSTTISVEASGGFAIPVETIQLTTTSIFGTTTINGELLMSTTPLQILADGSSTTTACVQLKKITGEIIKNPPTTPVSFLSSDSGLLGPGGAQVVGTPDIAFPQGGIYTFDFSSAGITDPGNPGLVTIDASAASFANDDSEIEVWGAQYWPDNLTVSVSPSRILCDGESTVKFTAQLVDDNGLPVFLEGRQVTFESQDTGKLVDPTDGDGIVTDQTDTFGVAMGTFRAKDCKLDNFDSDDVDVLVSTISPAIVNSTLVQIINPRGYRPTGVNGLTDQMIEHRDLDHENTPGIESHSSPSLISADGQKPTYVTAQVCEWTSEDPSLVEDVAHVDLSLDRDGDGFNDEFCNPVRREGVRIEFNVLNSNIVENKGTLTGQDDLEDSSTTVYLDTGEDGTATAVFNSAGTTPVTNEGCTDITITAQNGAVLDGPSYARVCSVQDESLVPNAAWVWASPAYISADGESGTTLRVALYDCDDNIVNHADVGQFIQANEDSSGVNPDDLAGQGTYDNRFGTDACRPVQMENAIVKFESLNPQIVSTISGGFKEITTTDGFGHADATFYSTGFDNVHIGKSEIKVFVDGTGSDVVQLNELFVGTEEKTWPWCRVTGKTLEDLYGPGAEEADTDNDQQVSDGELLAYIIRWFASSTTPPQDDVDDDDLIQAIRAWLND